MLASTGNRVKGRHVKIFHLEREGVHYDEAVGFVVIARDLDQAREYACGQAGDEGANAWYRPDVKVAVIGRSAAGEQARVVLRDFHAG
jgi:hypothetical protein